MKILHVNYSEIKGGAAIGVNRLHKALKKQGVNSEMLVVEKSTNDPEIHGPKSSFEELFSQSKSLLKKEGFLVVEHGYDQHRDLVGLAINLNLRVIDSIIDYQKIHAQPIPKYLD